MRYLNRLALCTIAFTSIQCFADGNAPLPPNQTIDGKSQAEWSELWWQWAGSFERDVSPVSDQSGERCHFGQSGSVWFLAGTYGSARTFRTCRVPAGKYLFFPLVNYMVSPRLPKPPCDVLANQAAVFVEDSVLLVLEVDGVKVQGLQAHRQASRGCFDVLARTGTGRRMEVAADGYYVMLPPLPVGEHRLDFGGILPSMSQAVTYRLTVR